MVFAGFVELVLELLDLLGFLLELGHQLWVVRDNNYL